MKHPVLTLMSILFLSFSSFASDIKQMDISSSIKEVTVYQGLAEVKRTGKIFLPKGMTKIIFKSLPVTIRENTISAKALGLKVLDVNMEKVYLVESRQETVKNLEKEIDDLREAENALADRQEVLRRSLRLLDSLNSMSSDKLKDEMRTAGKVNTLDWDAAMKYTEENSEKKMKEIRSLAEKRSDLSSQIAQKERTLSDITGPRYIELRNLNYQLAKEGKSDPRYIQNVNEASRILSHIGGDQENHVSLVVDVPEEKSYEIELVYHVSGADWNPVYDIRASSEKGKLDLGFSAEIRQRSGEDWKNVSLMLSSSEPFKAVEPPVISFWRIQAGQPLPQRSMKKAAPMMNMSAAKEMAAPSMMEEELSVADSAPPPPVSMEKFTSVVFPVSTPVTIASGSDKLKASIDTVTFSGKEIKLEYFASPDRTDNVFLFARLTNKMDYPLLAGSAAIYIDSDFVGQSYLNDFQPGEGRDFFLGSDPGIKAKKVLVKKFTDTFANSVKINYHYRVTIKNQKSRSVEISLKDIVPVSTSDDVKIKIDSIIPEPISTKEEMETAEYKNGLRRWTLELQPKEQKQIDMNFSVMYDSRLGAWPLR